MTEKGKARESTEAHQARPGWGGPFAPASAATSSSSPSGGYSDTGPTTHDAAYDPASFYTPGQLAPAASHAQHAGYTGFSQQVEGSQQSEASLVPELEGADSDPPVYSRRAPSGFTGSSGWSGASDLGRTPTLMSDTKDYFTSDGKYDTKTDNKEPDEDIAGKIQLSLNVTKELPPLPSSSRSKNRKDQSGASTPSLVSTDSVSEFAVEKDPRGVDSCPSLCIVIFIVGSRGDVQPYLALSLALIRARAHRVRIATHGEFKDFILGANQLLRGEYGGPKGDIPLEGRLEFFEAGGDARELMAYMVKNPGLMPGLDSLLNGDISAKQKMTAEYIKGFYQSTFFPDRRNGPFAADAIISNPPAFAHIHVAQSLGVPLHMSFTMPWTPTQAFQHPLVTVKESNAGQGMTNQISFTMAEVLMWQGLGELINRFRKDTLGLSRLTLRDGPSLTNRPIIPWTYCWSQSLIPKPRDWKRQVDIAGFYFLEGSSGFQPDEELARFLDAGPPPMYIGFGSVPVKDPAAMTSTIFDAVKLAGVRALVSAGWGGLGGIEPSKDIFILKGNIPHDWLFADGRVSAVCHHGGAGTTAIGLRNGLPTIVVPFFGDQQFWGDMISNAGAGPSPIPPKHLTAQTLAEAIAFVYSEDAQRAAQRMGEVIRGEDGVGSGVRSFHKHLPLLNMRCQVDPSRVAHWWSDELYLRLSGAAAATLHERGRLDISTLVLHRSKEYDFDRHGKDPGTGAIQGAVHVVTTSFSGVAELFYNPGQGLLDLTWGIHRAAFGIVYDVWEGIDNLPGMIGSDTRARGKITGFGSGCKEAGLGLAYGIWDGVTGLVTEPMVGAKADGARGAAKGAGKSLVNLITRPASGALGLAVLPFQGLAADVRTALRRTPEAVYQSPRHDLAFIEAAKMSDREKDDIVRQFEVLLKETKKRRREIRKKRHRLFLTGEMVVNPYRPKEEVAKEVKAEAEAEGLEMESHKGEAGERGAGNWGEDTRRGERPKDSGWGTPPPLPLSETYKYLKSI